MIGQVELFNNEQRAKIGRFLRDATGKQMTVCPICGRSLAPVGFVRLPIFARPDHSSPRYEGNALLFMCIQCGHLAPFTERPGNPFPDL